MTKGRRSCWRAVFMVVMSALATVAPRASGPTWTSAGDLSAPRWNHWGFLLPDGRVIVVGEGNEGDVGQPPTFTTEIFDPVSETWSKGPAPTLQHNDSEAVRLNDGRILVAGGRNGNPQDSTSPLATSEVFDPATNSWSATGALERARVKHTLTLLPDGKVLAAGGYSPQGFESTAEIFDPAANGGVGAWTFTGSMDRGRWMHSATLLNDGRVLVAGGENYSDHSSAYTPDYADTELYDPNTRIWTSEPPLTVGRSNHQAALLPDGRVIVIGGIVGRSDVATTEIFDGSTWTPGPSMAVSRLSFALTTLRDGSLLVTGGTNQGTATASAERYDPDTNRWTSNGTMNSPRRLHSMTLLADGRVLVAGGYDASVSLRSSEIGANLDFAWNAAPAFVAPTPADGTTFTVPVGTTFYPVIAARDADGSDTVTIAVAGLPTGALSSRPANPATLAVRWVPVAADVGLHSIVFTATDDRGASAAGVTVSVYVPPPPIAITLSPAPPAYAGGSMTWCSTFFDPALDTSYSATVDFGDGTGAQAADVRVGFDCAGEPAPAGVTGSLTLTHTYRGQGTYQILISVTGANYRNGGTATQRVAVGPPILVSISVEPRDATLTALQHQPYTATGYFSDGSSQPLPSGGGSGSGGSPTMQAWWIHFFRGLPAGAVCPSVTTPSAWLSQGLRNNNGTVQETWGTVQVSGTMTNSSVQLTVGCADPSLNVPTGQITASWTGTRYEGIFDFGGAQGALQITGWSQQVAPPTARYALGAAAVNGTVYAIGGTDGNSLLATVEAYHPANGWTTGLPSMPTPREGLGVVAVGGKIYAIGGRVAGGAASAKMEVFDPEQNGWATLADMPTARAHLAVVTDGTYVYAIGGDTGAANSGQVATVERYHPASDAWTSVAPMPAAGNFSAAGVLNQTIVVVGSGGNGGPSTRTDLYDISAKSWRSGAPLPFARGLMAAGVANGGLWLVGGSIDGTPSFDTWVYYPQSDPQPDRWTGSGAIPTARMELATAVVGDVIYAIGGFAPGGGPSLSANEALSTVPAGDWNPGPDIGGSSSLPTVQWQSGNTSVASIDQSGNAIALSAGATTIIASAGGIQCDLCGTLTVTKTTPNVRIFAPNPSSYGQTVTFTTSVSGVQGAAAPTGTVIFTIDGTQVAEQTLANGQASYSTNGLTASVCNSSPCYGHNVVVRYNGDGNYQSSSGTTNQFVNKAQPTMALTSSLSPSMSGQEVTFVAALAGPAGVPGPTGTITFAVDGNAVATQNVDSSGGAAYTTSTLAAGDRNVSARYNGDANFNNASRSITQPVQVPNRPPDCSAAVPSQTLLWPPDHRWVPIAIDGVTDPDGDATTVRIAGIFQDEPVNGVADGDTAPDGDGVGTPTALVRAERAGNPKVPGNGRVYHISFTATDGNAGSCSGEVMVTVPHDRSARTLRPVDDGARYNSITGVRKE